MTRSICIRTPWPRTAQAGRSSPPHPYEKEDDSVSALGFVVALWERHRIFCFAGVFRPVVLVARNGFPHQSAHGFSANAIHLYWHCRPVFLRSPFCDRRAVAAEGGLVATQDVQEGR